MLSQWLRYKNVKQILMSHYALGRYRTPRGPRRSDAFLRNILSASDDGRFFFSRFNLLLARIERPENTITSKTGLEVK